jgi:agmatine deiminase
MPATLTDTRVPAETEPQERVWMAFPPRGSSIAGSLAEAEEAWAAWSAVAHAILPFEPVTMAVDPSDLHVAKRLLSSEIELIETPLDDAWMRDIGPTFTLTPDGTLEAVDWVFNGWGAQEWARWDHDANVAGVLARAAGARHQNSPLVNEGGGMVFDGAGTVFLTETVQLDPGRNPTLDHAAVEAELERVLNTTDHVWLPRGLTRDSQTFGTRGHADMMLACPSPGRLLLHAQTNPAHPDHLITAEIRATLAASRDDAAGDGWEVTPLPAPTQLRDRDGWVDYNYVNHTAINGAVIACSFDDPADAPAADLLASAYPGREIVAVDARPIFARGGGIHCITLQQPRLDRPASPSREELQ